MTTRVFVPGRGPCPLCLVHRPEHVDAERLCAEHLATFDRCECPVCYPRTRPLTADDPMPSMRAYTGVTVHEMRHYPSLAHHLPLCPGYAVPGGCEGKNPCAVHLDDAGRLIEAAEWLDRVPATVPCESCGAPRPVRPAGDYVWRATACEACAGRDDPMPLATPPLSPSERATWDRLQAEAQTTERVRLLAGDDLVGNVARAFLVALRGVYDEDDDTAELDLGLSDDCSEWSCTAHLYGRNTKNRHGSGPTALAAMADCSASLARYSDKWRDCGASGFAALLEAALRAQFA